MFSFSNLVAIGNSFGSITKFHYTQHTCHYHYHNVLLVDFEYLVFITEKLEKVSLENHFYLRHYIPKNIFTRRSWFQTLKEFSLPSLRKHTFSQWRERRKLRYCKWCGKIKTKTHISKMLTPFSKSTLHIQHLTREILDLLLTSSYFLHSLSLPCLSLSLFLSLTLSSTEFWLKCQVLSAFNAHSSYTT